MDWCGGEPKHKAREGSKEGLENELHYANPALAQGADAFLRLEQTKGRGGAPLEARLREAIEVNLRTLASTYPPSPSHGHEVYHGQSGVGLLHMRLFQAATDESQRLVHLDAALAYASAAWQRCVEKLGGDADIDDDDEDEDDEEDSGADRVGSFLCGQAGVMALSAVVAHYRHQPDLRDEMVERLLMWHRVSLADPECELLYGRSGYVYCLVFVAAHIPERLLPGHFREVARKVLLSIIADGRVYSRTRRHESPLMYKWYHSEYLGAAHGLAGILHALLYFPDLLPSDDMAAVRGSADYLLDLLRREGNVPMCHGDKGRVNPVQWCHGAPGVVALFCRLHELTRESKYLAGARAAADCTWREGLLKKSISLCHGAVGNAYTFLTLHRHTREEEYLLRARVFVLWSLTSPHVAHLQPDCPYSLFEGLAGTTYAYAEMLDPQHSAFPAFEPPPALPPALEETRGPTTTRTDSCSS